MLRPEREGPSLKLIDRFRGLRGSGKEHASRVAEQDPATTMIDRLGLLPRLFGDRFFTHIEIDAQAVESIKRMADRGSVVYIMRHSSLADFFLINYLFLRQNLPLARMANGIQSFILRPLHKMIVRAIKRIFSIPLIFRREIVRYERRELAQQLVREGRPVLLFLRPVGFGMFGKKRALEAERETDDYLSEMIHSLWRSERDIYLVPLAIFWRKGPQQSRSSVWSIFYGTKERPGPIKKFISLLFNYKSLYVRIGKEIDLREFTERRKNEGEEEIAKKVHRVLQIFLHSEEKSVQGPMIRPRRKVREMILGDHEVVEAIDQIAFEGGKRPNEVRREATKYFNEIAANFHGSIIFLLDIFFNWIWHKIFSGIYATGLERVAEQVKHHPVVLIPCHRSHIDYLILSSLFYNSHLSPPHIAAGVNLSFWPLGFLFRAAGAYFIRRSFEDNELYKLVFRKYMIYLIKEGYTQEFFIEGGRSRSGKILNPKLGILATILNAFIQGARRDLYFVPISITYERLVEERSMIEEVEGKPKERESLRKLFGLWRLLRLEYGRIYVNFSAPISLNDELGRQRERFRNAAGNPDVEQEKRRFIEEFSYQLLREINTSTVAGAVPIVSLALLSDQKNAFRANELTDTMNDLLALLKLQNVKLMSTLERDAGDFRETLSTMLRHDDLRRHEDQREAIYYFDPAKRRKLDFYKNNIIHYFVVPSLMARLILRETTRKELDENLLAWVRFFRYEFVLPNVETIQEQIDLFFNDLKKRGIIEGERVIRATRPGRKFLRGYEALLANFIEAYFVVVDTVRHSPKFPLSPKQVQREFQRTFKKYFLLREIRHPESDSQVTYDNAIRYLINEGYLRMDGTDDGGKKGYVLEPGEAFDRMTDLHETLYEALRP